MIDYLDLFMQTPDEPTTRSRASLPDAIALDSVPSRRNSLTSTVAAINVVATGAHKKQLFVVRDFIRDRGPEGATREEIADATGVRLSAVCGRVRTLYRQGVIGSNPDHVRRGSCKQLQEVLVSEEHVVRWRGTERRHRLMLDGASCDLVHPLNDTPISEREMQRWERDHL